MSRLYTNWSQINPSETLQAPPSVACSAVSGALSRRTYRSSEATGGQACMAQPSTFIAAWRSASERVG